jgi:NAD+ kinase
MRLDRVWVIYRADSPPAQREARHCAKQLEALGAKVVSAMSGPRANPFPGLLAVEGELPNLAVVLGGDGTVLGAARHLAVHDIPLLSINVGGHLGFLTHDRRVLQGAEVWQRLLDDQFAIERRMMLQAMVDRRCAAERAEGPALLQQPDVEDDEEHHWALNDFYLRAYRDEISPTCTLELEIDGEVVDQVRGDGLILATPTGSTGYVMAAGGPILHPGIDAIIVTPICPMSLSSRTVVVPPRSRLVLWPLGDAGHQIKLWKDGVGCTVLQPGRVLCGSTGTPSCADGVTESKSVVLPNFDPQTPLGWKPDGQSAFTRIDGFMALEIERRFLVSGRGLASSCRECSAFAAGLLGC